MPKPMSARKVALAYARIAGYHEDSKLFTRLIIEARVSRARMTQAWQEGVRLRDAGVACTCLDCEKEASHA